MRWLGTSTEGMGFCSGRLEAAVAELLAQHGRSDDVIVASFNHAQVELFKALAPEVHTAPGTGQVAASGRALRARGRAPRTRSTRRPRLGVLVLPREDAPAVD